MSEQMPRRAWRDAWGAAMRAVVLTVTVTLLGLVPSQVGAQSPPAAQPAKDPTMEPTLAAIVVGAFVRSPDNVDTPARPRLLDYFIPDWREQLHAMPPFIRDTD